MLADLAGSGGRAAARGRAQVPGGGQAGDAGADDGDATHDQAPDAASAVLRVRWRRTVADAILMLFMFCPGQFDFAAR